MNKDKEFRVWLAHFPGRKPPPAGAICHVIYVSGNEQTGYCQNFNWIDGGIVAYRVKPEPGAKPPNPFNDNA